LEVVGTLAARTILIFWVGSTHTSSKFEGSVETEFHVTTVVPVSPIWVPADGELIDKPQTEATKRNGTKRVEGCISTVAEKEGG